MRVKVRLHPDSTQEKIIKLEPGFYVVWLKEPAFDDKANIALVKMLKNYFRREVKIVHGFKTRLKLVDIADK